MPIPSFPDEFLWSLRSIISVELINFHLEFFPLHFKDWEEQAKAFFPKTTVWGHLQTYSLFSHHLTWLCFLNFCPLYTKQESQTPQSSEVLDVLQTSWEEGNVYCCTKSIGLVVDLGLRHLVGIFIQPGYDLSHHWDDRTGSRYTVTRSTEDNK